MLSKREYDNDGCEDKSAQTHSKCHVPAKNHESWPFMESYHHTEELWNQM